MRKLMALTLVAMCLAACGSGGPGAINSPARPAGAETPAKAKPAADAYDPGEDV